MDRLRIGTLGAARITSSALIKPARQIPEVTVAAVAARDPERARRFAAKHRIRRVHASYQALIDDPAIDAIYNPLPNSLHAQWTLRAIEAGKHVLCEKPFTANAAEAAEVAAAAAASGLVVMEAFHYRYHPLARRMQEVVGGGDRAAPLPGSLAVLPAAPLLRHPLLLRPGRRGHHGRGLLRDQLAADARPGRARRCCPRGPSCTART